MSSKQETKEPSETKEQKEQTEPTSCAFCYEDFTKLTRASIDCVACDVKSCRSCIRKYLLQSTDLPHCMHCKNRWERDFMVNATLKSFVDGVYRKHRTELLFEVEKSRLPETMPAIENYQKVNTMKKERDELTEEICKIKAQLYLMKMKQSNLSRQIIEFSNGKCSSSKRVFKRACPRSECLGFLSSSWKCGVCDHWACSKCFEGKGLHKDDPHTCDPNTLASAQLLKKETKPCPSCASSIFKISGCDQMWCTQCHIAFSWKTGRQVNGVIHNPHFYQWQKNGTGQAPIQAPGAILCGGLPDWNRVWHGVQILKQEVFTKNNKYRVLETKVLMDQMIQVHRGVRHFQEWVLRRLRERCQDIGDNTNLRIRYAVKEITEIEMKTQLIRRDKIKNKRRSILEIYELVNVVFIESLRDIHEWMESNIKKGLKFTNNSDKVPFTNNLIKIVQENLNRCNNVRIYANSELKKTSVLYSQNVYVIKGNFQTESAKFTRKDLQ